MACSETSAKAQIPIGCQLCETGTKIKWRCVECSLLICDTCKKIHLKITKDHRIVDIKTAQIPTDCQLCKICTDIKWKCEACEIYFCDTCKKVHAKQFKDHEIKIIGDSGNGNYKLEKDENGHKAGKDQVETNKSKDKVNITGNVVKQHYENSQDWDKTKMKFKVLKKYPVDLEGIHYMAICADGSLWIGSNYPDQLQHVKISSDSLTVLSTFNIEIYGMAMLPSGPPLILAPEASTVKKLNEKTGKLINSKFSVHLWTLTCIYVTRDQKIALGGFDGKNGIITMTDSKGQRIVTYREKNDEPFLTYPTSIATSQNGSIFISDKKPKRNRGKVAVIKPNGDIQFYNGHSEINTADKLFDPHEILMTLADNALVLDLNTFYLHILNNRGDFIGIYNLRDIGITSPYSFVLTSSGNNILISSVGFKGQPKGSKATLYEVEFSGV